MNRTNREKHHDYMRKRALYTSARMFLEQGYTAASLRHIAAEAGMNIGSLINLFRNKEDILCELVEYVIEGQFTAARKMICDVTEDKILLYATETTLQLYMAESAEHIREMYNVAYSLPKSMAIIRRNITEKLMDIFGELHPDFTYKDFYKLEIASGGIMRGFISCPCDDEFTMKDKVGAFLETTLLIYRVPQEKINEAIAFVERFDYPDIAQQIIDFMLKQLDKAANELNS